MGWVQIACIVTNRNVPSNICCYRKNKIYLHPQQILPKHSQNWHRPGALAFLNQQKFIRGQTRNSGKALLGPLLQQGGAKTSESFPCSLPKEGGRLVPYMGRGLGCVQGLAQRGYLGGLPTSWVVLRAGGIHSTLFLFLALQKWWLGFVFFLSCYPEFAPSAHACSYFQSLIISLYFVAQGDVCPGASPVALQRKGSGPSLSQNDQGPEQANRSTERSRSSLHMVNIV